MFQGWILSTYYLKPNAGLEKSNNHWVDFKLNLCFYEKIGKCLSSNLVFIYYYIKAIKYDVKCIK